MIGIYKITSPTEKVYIGQSWNILKRKNRYKNGGCSKQPHVCNSIKKHGWSSHTFEVLMNVSKNITQQMFDAIEQAYMDYYRRNGFELLNLREAGSTGRHSEETKDRLKIARNRRPLYSEETKQKLRDANKNKTLPLEHRRKIGLANGIPVNQFTKEGVFVRDYPSMMDAGRAVARQGTGIHKACVGVTKTCAGFIWKLKENN